MASGTTFAARGAISGAEEQPALRPSALTTRVSDFWLLGGASLVVWLAMICLQGYRGSWAVDQHFKNLTVTAASLSVLVNYPHFLISYKLAYSRGLGFILLHWWQLLVVPVLLFALLAWAFMEYSVPMAQLPATTTLIRIVGQWGDNAQMLSGPRLGDALFGLMFNLMVLTVGWHYTKQVFGCMMVYAYFDQYPLSKLQRMVAKWALLSIWWLNIAYGNRRSEQQEFSLFRYYSFDLPDIAVPLTTAIVAIGILAMLYEVVWTNYKKHHRLPSLNFLVPAVALYAWWLPATRQFEFYFLLTPLFHSLQYLTFVYKMENTRLRGMRHPEVRGAVLVLGVVLAGWLAFELVPNEMDNALKTFEAWQMFFFFTAATLFINIHHYFLDNVLWRFKDPHVRQYLLNS